MIKITLQTLISIFILFIRCREFSNPEKFLCRIDKKTYNK